MNKDDMLAAQELAIFILVGEVTVLISPHRDWIGTLILVVSAPVMLGLLMLTLAWQSRRERDNPEFLPPLFNTDTVLAIQWFVIFVLLLEMAVLLPPYPRSGIETLLLMLLPPIVVGLAWLAWRWARNGSHPS